MLKRSVLICMMSLSIILILGLIEMIRSKNSVFGHA